MSLYPLGVFKLVFPCVRSEVQIKYHRTQQTLRSKSELKAGPETWVTTQRLEEGICVS